MKAYRTSYRNPFEIQEVEVIRFTEACVILPVDSAWHKKTEERKATVSEWHHYHKTRKGAVDFVRCSLKGEVGIAEERLERSRKRLQDFERRESEE